MEKTRKKLPPTTIPDKLIIFFFFFFFLPSVFACPGTLIIADVTTIALYLRLRVQSSTVVNGFLMHDVQTAFGTRSYGSSSSSLLFSLSLSLFFFVYVKERAVIGTCSYALWVKSPDQRVRGTYGSCAFLGAIVS